MHAAMAETTRGSRIAVGFACIMTPARIVKRGGSFQVTDGIPPVLPLARNRVSWGAGDGCRVRRGERVTRAECDGLLFSALGSPLPLRSPYSARVSPPILRTRYASLA